MRVLKVNEVYCFFRLKVFSLRIGIVFLQAEPFCTLNVTSRGESASCDWLTDLDREQHVFGKLSNVNESMK